MLKTGGALTRLLCQSTHIPDINWVAELRGGEDAGHFPSQPTTVKMSNAVRAQCFVDGLERIDAELRTRMARLGMGEIEDLSSDSTVTGCGLCFEPYQQEDKPGWLASSAREAQEWIVVGIPCAGHHVVHAVCLRDWFATKDPTLWACPFCRAVVHCDREHLALGSEAKAALGPGGRSVREQVRFRERAQGWRCDAPACLPRYPDEANRPSSPSSRIGAEAGETSEKTANMAADEATEETVDETAEDNEGPKQTKSKLVELIPPDQAALGELYMLTPCHHEIHLDCLMTALRVADGLLDTDDAAASEMEIAAPPVRSTPYRLATVPQGTKNFDCPPAAKTGPQRASLASLLCGPRQQRRTTSLDPWDSGPSPRRSVWDRTRSALAQFCCIGDDTDESDSAPERVCLRTYSPPSPPPEPVRDALSTSSNSMELPPVVDADDPGQANAADSSQLPPSQFARTPGGHLKLAGRWVSCPTCRKEVWACTPVLQRRRTEAGVADR